MCGMFKKLREFKFFFSFFVWLLGLDYNSIIGLYVYGNFFKFG